MKALKYLFLFMIGFSFQQTQGQNASNPYFKDLYELNPQYQDSYVIKEIATENESIKRSRRDAHLLVAEFKLTAPENCTVLVSPESFACNLIFRSHPKMMISKAIGTKHLPDGKKDTEHWIEEPHEGLVYALQKNETLTLQVVFEVPKEVDEFEFHCLKKCAKPFEL
jgi:hypothetical protein